MHRLPRLGAAGYRWYEISNRGRPGLDSQHNLIYWQREPYEAVGPGAPAFDGVRRRWNAAALDGYLVALASIDGSAPVLLPRDAEGVDPRIASAERDPRPAAGHQLGAGRGPSRAAGEHLAWGLEASLLERVSGAGGGADERVRLTIRGRLLSNEVFARLA